MTDPGSHGAIREPRWPQTINDARVYLFLLQVDNTLAAFAISGNEGRGKLFIYEIHVASTHRKQGLGRTLINHMDPVTRHGKRKHSTISLNVHRANTSAQAFYARMGFGVTEDISGDAAILEMVRVRA